MLEGFCLTILIKMAFSTVIEVIEFEWIWMRHETRRREMGGLGTYFEEYCCGINPITLDTIELWTLKQILAPSLRSSYDWNPAETISSVFLKFWSQVHRVGVCIPEQSCSQSHQAVS